MKIGEALSRLKKEKSRLARLISLRKENIFIEEGKTQKFDPIKLTKDIDSKIEEIRTLKISIQRVNLETKVVGEEITLAEAIIKISDIRSKLSQLSCLFDKKKDIWYKSKDEKELIAQMSENDVEDMIEQLEIEKSQLDNKVQITNWTAKLNE